ncbi:MAG TPA: hypothetical protein DF383_10970, partial [Deltaproteobacteria bacterium]|nr:hypothetical protein [Deltaproteobacteria bacterium]
YLVLKNWEQWSIDFQKSNEEEQLASIQSSLKKRYKISTLRHIRGVWARLHKKRAVYPMFQ